MIRVVTKENKLINQIESILFSCGKAISIDEINAIISNYIEAEAMIEEVDLSSKKEKKLTNYMIKKTLKELKEEYEKRDGPLMIVDEDDENKWKISVKEAYIGLARTINPHTELSKALMETLSVIAWKQPILQSTVIKIRTTNAYDHINELIQYGFVVKQKYGRSFLLKLTQKFYDYFDVDKKKIRKIFKTMTDVPGADQTNLGELIDTLDENEKALHMNDGTFQSNDDIVDAITQDESDDILTKEDLEELPRDKPKIEVKAKDKSEVKDASKAKDTAKTTTKDIAKKSDKLEIDSNVLKELEKSIDDVEKIDIDKLNVEKISKSKSAKVDIDNNVLKELEKSIDDVEVAFSGKNNVKEDKVKKEIIDDDASKQAKKKVLKKRK